MRTKLCWICGNPVKQSAVGAPTTPFYLEVWIVQVNRPYATDFKTKHVFICDDCSVKKLGMSAREKLLLSDINVAEGKNLNP